MAEHRLTEQEITSLQAQGCRAEDWARIMAPEEFIPGTAFRNVSFSGDIRLGLVNNSVRVRADEFAPAGIDNCRLHNVRIGRNCLLRDASIRNTDIEDDVVIDNVQRLAADGHDANGGGQPVPVLAEDGARQILNWRQMSSQLAHVLCHLKGLPAAEALTDVIRRETTAEAGDRCRIGRGCRLYRSGELRNIVLGPGVALDGVTRLSSCRVEGGSAPASIGSGVSAEQTIFLAASVTDSGAQLENCLVGEGAYLGKGLFAQDSMFFANADFRAGEVLATMAGPFSVSHHKATLVLACQNSFANFGSGSNSANHHFKLGPRHGGVLRRGVRAGSGSFLLWPGDIGAFTTIVGRHASGHLDTAIFPFSLLVAQGESSLLIPGVNLFGIGLFRDAGKWAGRDKRGGIARPLDMVNTAVLSPYTMQAVEQGAAILRRALANGEDVRCGGTLIPAGRIAPGLRLYEAALTVYIGEVVLRRAAAIADGRRVRAEDVAGVVARATERGGEGGVWRDWGGMLLAGEDAEAFVHDAENGRLGSAEVIRSRFEAMHARYAANELAWAAWRWRREYGTDAAAAADFTRHWREAVLFRKERMLRDAGKEYAENVMAGFGMEEPAAATFLRLRGKTNDDHHAQLAIEEANALLSLAEGVLLQR